MSTRLESPSQNLTRMYTPATPQATRMNHITAVAIGCPIYGNVTPGMDGATDTLLPRAPALCKWAKDEPARTPPDDPNMELWSLAASEPGVSYGQVGQLVIFRNTPPRTPAAPNPITTIRIEPTRATTKKKT
jgi:hypothetical protein